jgi:hypothetical protein
LSFQNFANDLRFRLVALQLEELGNLRTESKIRAAMSHLPSSLDDFYNRILLNIRKQDQKPAIRALQWLAFAARPLSLKELGEAIIISHEREPCLDDEDRFMDSKDLLDILSSGLVSAVRVPLGFHDEIHCDFSEDDKGGEMKSGDDSDAKSHGSFTSAGYVEYGDYSELKTKVIVSLPTVDPSLYPHSEARSTAMSWSHDACDEQALATLSTKSS